MSDDRNHIPLSEGFDSTEVDHAVRELTLNKYVDVIVRVQGDADSHIPSWQFDVHETNTVRESFRSFFEACNFRKEVLARAVRRQKTIIDYKDYYISFLSGLVTEEEFDKISEDFVQERDEIEPEELARYIRVVTTETGAPFTTAELSDVFNVDAGRVRQAIGRLEKNRKHELDRE